MVKIGFRSGIYVFLEKRIFSLFGLLLLESTNRKWPRKFIENPLGYLINLYIMSMRYTKSILCFSFFIFWVKNIFLSNFFSNKLECRQCVFMRYQGDRLSKYLNSVVHPRIWQIWKSWEKNTKNKQITSFYLFDPGTWKETQKARRSFGWWKAWRCL